jgi:putative two-component system response regulator
MPRGRKRHVTNTNRIAFFGKHVMPDLLTSDVSCSAASEPAFQPAAMGAPVHGRTQPQGIGPVSDTRPSESLVMIVDDEPINVKVVQKHLKLAGYSRFVGISDAMSVLSSLRRTPPDVLLLDVMMPDVNGLDLLEQIRDDASLGYFPVLILTASDSDETRTRALELGVTDFLNKPVQPSELVIRVRNALLVKAHHDHLKSYSQELERQVRLRTAELAASRLELIHCLARAAEYRDNETGHHVMRVGCYAGLIARRLELDPKMVELIEHAAPLHDLGKIGIPDAILLKPGKLGPDEFDVMRKHTVFGKRTFAPMSNDEWRTFKTHTVLGEKIMDADGSPLIQMAAKIALTHHEKWDGSGYPLGLSGEDIPLAGRITAVADVFDALSSPRPYKPAWPLDRCFAAMEEGRGTHFDPVVLDAFCASREDIVRIRMKFADTE